MTMRVWLVLPLCCVVSAVSAQKCDKNTGSCDSDDAGTLSKDIKVSKLIAEFREVAAKYSTEKDDVDAVLRLRDEILQVQKPLLRGVWPPWQKDKESKDTFNEFKKWCEDNYQSDGVALHMYPGMGIGVKSTKSIKQGDTIMTVYANQTMSTLFHRSDFACIKQLRPAKVQIDGLWRLCMLIFKMLEELYKDSSWFDPWMEMLPREFTHILWAKSSDFEILRGTYTFEDSVHTMEEMAAEYGFYYNYLHENPDCAQEIGIPLEKFTLEAFRWAYIITLSRNYDGSMYDSETNKVMIPCWDSFNHADNIDLDTHNVPVEPNDNSNKETMKLGPPWSYYETYAVKDIESDKQVFMHYLAPLDPSEAFTTWGFVHAEAYFITLYPTTDDPSFDQRLRLINAVKLRDNGFYFYRKKSLTRHIKTDYFAKAVDIANLKLNSELTPTAIRNTWIFLGDQIKRTIDSYPRSLRKYEAELEEHIKNDKDFNEHSRICYEQIIAELKLLNDIRDYAAKSSGVLTD